MTITLMSIEISILMESHNEIIIHKHNELHTKSNLLSRYIVIVIIC